MSPSRRSVALVIAVLLTASAAACTPTPEPTPTPTGFASEDEAFAAAEATYRAYIDALNARNAGDKDADPTAYLIGDAREEDKKTRDLLEESNRSFSGDFQIVSFAPHDKPTASEMHARVCMDSSQVFVLDAQGNDVTPEDDIKQYTLEIVFNSTQEEPKISASERISDTC